MSYSLLVLPQFKTLLLYILPCWFDIKTQNYNLYFKIVWVLVSMFIKPHKQLKMSDKY